MPPELIVPASVMSLAFLFYTGGVWTERLARELRPSHVATFWAGVLCDSAATHLMLELIIEQGGVRDWPHTLTGAAALLLMAAHAIWASWVLARGDGSARRRFHRYSVTVWVVWLVPYVSGMAAGIARGTSG